MAQLHTETRLGERGAWISIGCYLALSALKLSVGYAAGSDALLADGLNNVTDVGASAAVLIGLGISRKPADHNHPYGHSRAETIASQIASFLMMAVGLQVLFSSVRNLWRPPAESPDMIAAWTALFSAAVMLGVYRYNLHISRTIKSHAMKAAAYDNRSDALISAGAFAGIVGARFGATWLDAAAAIIVGAIICKTAWTIFSEASHTLTDGFNQDQLQRMKKTVDDTPGVRTASSIRARTHGNKVFVDVIVQVDNRLSVVESHSISDEIEKRLSRRHSATSVHVHVEPAKT